MSQKSGKTLRTLQQKGLMMSRKHSRWPYTLRQLDLFARCSNAELDHIAALMTPAPIAAGNVILAEGNHDRQFVVIAGGRVEVTCGSDERHVANLGSGSFIGEMSLLDNLPRSATVTAVDPLEVYVCTEQEFGALLTAAPSVAAKIRGVASERRELRKAA